MFAFSHLFTGIVVSELFEQADILWSATRIFAASAIITSFIPDIDGLFYKNLKDHHKSILHMPLFWAALVLALIVSGKVFGVEVLEAAGFGTLVGSATHLTMDFIFGRTTGLRILAPFSSKEYSLCKIYPQAGEIHPIRCLGPKHMKFYRENKLLCRAEIVIVAFCLIYIFV